MSILTQADMIDLFQLAGTMKKQILVRKKQAPVVYEISHCERRVLTKFGEEIETKNIAKPGDYILTGLSGERYVLTPEKFNDRYEIVDAMAIPKTEQRLAVQWDLDPVEFIADWGEPMVCLTDDYLISPIDMSEVYRVKESEFIKTYELCEK